MGATVRRALTTARRWLVGIGNRWRRRRLTRARARRPPAPVVDWALSVEGPGWLAELLAGSFRSPAPGIVPGVVLVSGGDGADAPSNDVAPPRVGFRTGLPDSVGDEPFVDPRQANPHDATWPEGLPADLLRRARDGARIVVPDRPRSAATDAWRPWLTATHAAHGAYRAAHARTTHDLAAAIAARAALLPPARREDVTVVTVTCRPAELGRLVANVARQTHPTTRLLLVVNGPGFDDAAVEQAVGSLPDTVVVRTLADQSLGACLNIALDRATTRLVAKMDDDDEYGPAFLADLMLAHRFADAAVVGKHSTFAHLVGADVTVLRAPGREFEYTSHLAGGTLLVDRERTDARFPDVSVGEDGGFLRDCERRGGGVFAADRFNYLQRRHGANTWAVDDGRFARGAVHIGAGTCPGDVLA